MIFKIHREEYAQSWQAVGKAFVALMIFFITLSESVLGQNSTSPNPSRTEPPGSKMPDPPPTGTPPGSSGGSERPGDSKCPDTDIPVISFLPHNTNVKVASAFPIFWFYIPFTPSEVDSFTFVVQDESEPSSYGGKVILKAEQTLLSLTPGLIHLQLSDEVQPLESDRLYSWYFSINCDPDKIEDRIALGGTFTVDTLNPALYSQLELSSPEERVDLYLQNGYQYDAFSLLAMLRLQEPRNVQLMSEWEELLEEFNLSEIASESILLCCSLENDAEESGMQ